MKTMTRFTTFSKVMLFTLVCTSLIFSACSDESDDPQPANAPVDLPSNVIGTFTGQLTYTDGGSVFIVNSEDGTATLTKTGDKTYSVSFSDDAPAITGLKFKAAAGGAYASLDSDGSASGMDISATSLSIGVTNASKNWAFTGTK